jgi:hypothetical protein
MVESQKGLQGRGGARMLREATEGKEGESQEERGSPALRTHPVSSGSDELLIALNNWGKNAEKKNSTFSRNKIERRWNDLSEFEAFSTEVPWCPLEALPRDLPLVGEIAA